MRVLISAVGDTDPFRNFHDGALIHIARKYRPEKVILIFSEHTAKKNKVISKKPCFLLLLIMSLNS
ncbi:hypothetical protein Y021_04700 [Streptococcus thermophilus 1F8CT]|nr:hypothetical protein Y021_04700 [Streptococcus thermophilus 1F8CT]